MEYSFFAYMSRMKLINRWALMRNSFNENIMEHSYMVTAITQCLCELEIKLFGKNVDILKATSYALYHDFSEVLTGDLPTPIKYYNKTISDTYKTLEDTAIDTLAKMLPKEIEESYSVALKPDIECFEFRLMKAADKLSALIKCMEERSMNNADFNVASIAVEKDLHEKYSDIPSVEYFVKHFLPAFGKTIDEL